MIQRLQTLFLILAIAANGFMYTLDCWSATATNDKDQVIEQLNLDLIHFHYTTELSGKGSTSYTNTWLIALHSLSTFLGVGAIFLFRNRPLQLKISRFAMLIETGLLVLLFFYIDGAAQDYFTNSISYSSYEAGVFLPIVSVVGFFLANVFIMRDERLVRSAERLR